MEKISLKAYAKINLTLGITGKRNDGYHLIDSIMQTIDIYDIIKIKKSNSLKVLCSNSSICDEENIVYKTAEFFFTCNNIKNGAEITIIKNIPLAAGLGGGSTDAAAVIMGLNILYDCKMTETEMCGLGLKLGADVPFFIKGGTKRVKGIGEEIINIKSLSKCFFILVKDQQKPSTSVMYNELDKCKYSAPDNNAVEKALEQNNLYNFSKLLVNSFSSVWKSPTYKDDLLKRNALAVSLSGSGPVYFALFDKEKTAEQAYKYMKSQNVECYFSKPVDYSIKLD